MKEVPLLASKNELVEPVHQMLKLHKLLGACFVCLQAITFMCAESSTLPKRESFRPLVSICMQVLASLLIRDLIDCIVDDVNNPIVTKPKAHDGLD